jgi:hypothetical protein
MSRAQITINDKADRERARRWVSQARPGTRIEFKAPVRTLPQNDRMWAMLSDISRQHRILERKYTPAEWKDMFLAAYAEAMGLEIKHLPAIHRAGLIPCGRSSSDLEVREMTEFIESIFAWGAEHGIAWSDPKIKQLKGAE